MPPRRLRVEELGDDVGEGGRRLEDAARRHHVARRLVAQRGLGAGSALTGCRRSAPRGRPGRPAPSPGGPEHQLVGDPVDAREDLQPQDVDPRPPAAARQVGQRTRPVVQGRTHAPQHAGPTLAAMFGRAHKVERARHTRVA